MPPRSRVQTLMVQQGRRMRRKVDSVIARYSLVGNPPVFDNTRFPWVSAIESDWRAIRREAEGILQDRDSVPPLRAVSPDHYGIATDDKWKSFFLWGYGYRVDPNCARCPETTRIVERIPGMMSAFFSILAPGTHIKRHRGVSKGILNCHLALIVPQASARCRMVIDGRTHIWQEGKALLFDDTFRHEVWNDTDEERVVLLVQVKRPVRFPGSLMSAAFLGAIRHSPFIWDARRNLIDWFEKIGTPISGPRGEPRRS